MVVRNEKKSDGCGLRSPGKILSKMRYDLYDIGARVHGRRHPPTIRKTRSTNEIVPWSEHQSAWNFSRTLLPAVTRRSNSLLPPDILTSFLFFRAKYIYRQSEHHAIHWCCFILSSKKATTITLFDNMPPTSMK